MTRTERLYEIYNTLAKSDTPIHYIGLVASIMRAYNVLEPTAKGYIESLIFGITINKKVYRVIDKSGMLSVKKDVQSTPDNI